MGDGDGMALGNAPYSSYLWRIYWKAKVFQWLQEKRRYDGFDLDACLKKLEQNPLMREAALVAFWGSYLGEESPPFLSDQQLKAVERLLDYGSTPGFRKEELKDLAFVKLHLAGLATICLIRPELPIIETPSVVPILEKAKGVYQLIVADRSSVVIDEIVEAPDTWGNRYFDEDLFIFSAVLLSGITDIELSLVCVEERNYEEAFSLITNGAWNICAATMHPAKSRDIEELRTLLNGKDSESFQDEPTEILDFEPYLPHSGKQFDIQEVANIFEEVRRHSKDIKDWHAIEVACSSIKYLGDCDLYDWLGSIRDGNGEEFGAAEYWEKALTFAEVQETIVSSPVSVLTTEAIERAKTKGRLKRDFFASLWEEMEEKTREILVDAETQWAYNKLDNMIKDIWQLLEPELAATFPFLEPTVRRSDVKLVLTRMKDELLNNTSVRASIEGLKIDNWDKKWAKDELPKFLQKVVEIRNYFLKEQQFSEKSSAKHRNMMDKAVTVHGELLGIGCEGVLPRLMKIKRASHSKK